jgi:hypothetical protein
MISTSYNRARTISKGIALADFTEDPGTPPRGMWQRGRFLTASDLRECHIGPADELLEKALKKKKKGKALDDARTRTTTGICPRRSGLGS